jgi:hypothetical protein
MVLGVCSGLMGMEDTGVVYEDVEAGLLGCEGEDCGLDC